MKTLECLGAAGGVTGSSYLLTDAKGGRLLIDCGTFQGLEKKEAHNHDGLNVDPKSLDGIVLTHAHLDHSGNIPFYVKDGFKGSIYMTQPTADLVPLLWKDQLMVALQRGERPCFSCRDIIQALHQIVPVPLNQAVDIDNFTVVFRNAHHILGSASLWMTEKDPGNQTIAFSGDLGNTSNKTDAPMVGLKHADVVVMESTYGDKNHQLDDPKEIIQDEINQIERQKKGSLLIPAFSIDRTQTLLRIIWELKQTGKIRKKTPIFLDSPMGILATDIYRRHLNNFLEDDFGGRYDDHFKFDGLVTTYHHKASERIAGQKGPKVIITSSGMMEGGRVRRHAIDCLPDINSRILFVGYLAEDTLGRKIADGAKKVFIDDQLISVNASVSVTGSLSSHADQDGLIKWLRHLNSPDGVRQVILTHGGETQRQTLAGKISQELDFYNVILPQRNQPIAL